MWTCLQPERGTAGLIHVVTEAVTLKPYLETCSLIVLHIPLLSLRWWKHLTSNEAKRKHNLNLAALPFIWSNLNWVRSNSTRCFLWALHFHESQLKDFEWKWWPILFILFPNLNVEPWACHHNNVELHITATNRWPPDDGPGPACFFRPVLLTRKACFHCILDQCYSNKSKATGKISGR